MFFVFFFILFLYQMTLPKTMTNYSFIFTHNKSHLPSALPSVEMLSKAYLTNSVDPDQTAPAGAV